MRKLSVFTDRLPAIAGLASRLHAEELGVYHAGMWESSLPVSMLWTEHLHEEEEGEELAA
jgi:hypothetical protein